MMNEFDRCIDEWAELVAQRNATIAALEQRINDLETNLFAATATVASLENRLAYVEHSRDRLRARVGELEEALRASCIGLDDWLNQYASELCDKARVQEAIKRIEYHGGTLSYIARLQDKNKRALEGKEEHGTRRDE